MHPIVLCDSDTENPTGLPVKAAPPINGKSQCLGLLIVLPEGQLPETSYPWALHTQANYPWTAAIHNKKLYLCADDCMSEAFNILCVRCAALHWHRVVCSVRKWIEEGAPEHIPWYWLSISQLHERETRLRHQINTQKLTVLNAARALGHRNRVIDDHKRFMLAVASGRFNFCFIRM